MKVSLKREIFSFVVSGCREAYTMYVMVERRNEASNASIARVSSGRGKEFTAIAERDPIASV